MSSPQYPSTLPTPQTLTIQSVERRVLSDIDGPRQSRTYQRERHAYQQISFVLTFEQAEAFQSWWRDDLEQGGIWFGATKWPLPQGVGLGEYRFTSTPQWSLIMGAGWKVSAECEVRSAPPIEALYFTSVLYPFIEEDSMSIAVPQLMSGLLMRVVEDALSVAVPTLEDGSLDVTISFIAYDPEDYPDELSVAVPTLESGTLVVTINYLSYDDGLPEELAVAVPTLQSGTLIQNAIYYQNWPTESMSVGVPTLTGGTLE